MFRAEAALVRKQELRLNKSLADPNRALVLDGTLFLCAKVRTNFHYNSFNLFTKRPNSEYV